MKLTRIRLGELLAAAGAVCVIVSLTLPWYENSEGKLSAWSTFGPAVVLLILATIAALVLFLATLTERTPALPVAAGVWCVLFGLIGVIAAIVQGAGAPRPCDIAVRRRLAGAGGRRGDPAGSVAVDPRRTDLAV